MGASATPKKKKKPAVSKKKASDGRIRVVLGLFFLLLAFFAGLSFISYFFTWKADQSFLDTELATNLADPDVRVENLAGGNRACGEPPWFNGQRPGKNAVAVQDCHNRSGSRADAG